MYIFKSQGEVKTTESDLRFLKRMSLWMSAYFLSQKTMSRLGRHSPALNIKFSFAERDFFHIPYATLGLKSGGILNIYPMDNVELAFAPETPFAHLMDELANWYFFHRSGWLPDYITQGFDDQNDATTALLERGPKNLSFDYKKQIRDHAKSMSGLGPEFLAGYDLTGPVLPTDNKGISFGASGAESCSALRDGDQLLLDEEDSPLEEPYLGVESDFSSEDAPDFFNKTLLDDSSVASAEYNSFSFYDHSSGFSDKALQDLKSLDHVALRKSAFVLVQPASMMMDEVKHLNFLCRKLKEGVDWKTLMMQSSAQEKEILSIFSAHLKASWSRRGFGELSDRDLTHIGSLFYAVPFALENKQEDWQSILHIIEKDISQIVRNAGGHTDDLLSIISKTSCQLWNTSFVTTRSELLEKIISASLPSADPKTYEKDIEKLKAHSRNHVERLQKSRCLPLVSEKYLRLSENDESQEDKGSDAINIKDNGQISLLRSFFPLLKEASKAGSLFVVGDPGVGKSASLVRLAQTLEARGAPVVFLNIDRFTTLRHKKDFKKKLELENYIIDILKAWPKEEKGYLIIDGLDATRGCVSENIFCSFLEDA